MEIRLTLERYGAKLVPGQMASGTVGVVFQHGLRVIRIGVPAPDKGEGRFALTAKRMLKRSKTQIRALVERDMRRCWRIVALMVRAKLEAIDNGVNEYYGETFIIDNDGNRLRDQDPPVPRMTSQVPEVFPGSGSRTRSKPSSTSVSSRGSAPGDPVSGNGPGPQRPGARAAEAVSKAREARTDQTLEQVRARARAHSRGGPDTAPLPAFLPPKSKRH